jgi:hypothetical protein
LSGAYIARAVRAGYAVAEVPRGGSPESDLCRAAGRGRVDAGSVEWGGMNGGEIQVGLQAARLVDVTNAGPATRVVRLPVHGR